MTALPLVAALAWTLALVIDNQPFGAVGALLVGVGILAVSAVSVVGMTVAGGRWAHRLGVVSVVEGFVVAAMRPIDLLWIMGLVLTVATGSALFLPQVTSRIRKLPAAAGPPKAAIVAPLLLLTAPFLIGVTIDGSAMWAALMVALTAPLAAYWFSRVLPGGLVAIRLVWPILAIALAPLLRVPAGVVTVLLGSAVALVAWRPEVKVSFHPPSEPGTSYPIPPELAPQDILDAAHIDDKGRRR